MAEGDSKDAVSMNWFDKTIQFFAPEKARMNLEARVRLKEFERNAATPGRLRGYSGGLHSNGSPETHKTNRDRLNLMWEARDLEKNDAVICGILERMTQYIVGRLEYKANTGDRETDRIYQDYFHAWCKRCDVTRRFTFREMVEIALRSALRDGDYGFAFVDTDEDILLQGVEADRIGNPHDHRLEKNYIGGITIGEYGEPTSFKIFQRTTENQYNFDKDLPPEHFMHFFKPTRNDQYRGVSFLAPALPHARDLHEIFGFEKQGAKFASMWAAFIRKKQPYETTAGEGWGIEEVDPRTGQKKGFMEAQPGKVSVLDGDTDIDFAPGVQRPSGAFVNLVDTVMHKIALGLNLPYGFVYKMSSFGGVTARLETQQAQRTFEWWQRLLADKVLDRVRDQVLSRAIYERKIPQHPNYRMGSWTFGAHITADIQHQTNADLQLIQAGLKTRTAWCAEHDLDFEETQRTLASETNIMEEAATAYEMPIEALHDGKPGISELLANMRSKDAPPPPLIAQGVDMKPFIEISEQVGEGSMDRETAINQLVEVYGLNWEQAERLVPIPPPQPQFPQEQQRLN